MLDMTALVELLLVRVELVEAAEELLPYSLVDKMEIQVEVQSKLLHQVSY